MNSLILLTEGRRESNDLLACLSVIAIKEPIAIALVAKDNQV
ncbi:hypothetical protein EV06_0375 [Prochlorococcus sp. MIT 0602]|nr:hypothetical protein EV06_0375 [Prochlorococcus sp. MIT 0602]